MKLYPDRFEQRLARGLDPVYLIAGPEHLLVEEACDAVRRAARGAGVDERIVFEVDGRFDWRQLGSATETLSLFAGKRLIELRIPTGKPGREGGAALRTWIERDSDDILLVKCNAWDLSQEKSAWCKALEQAGVYLPCWTIKPHQLPDWIERRLSTRGVRADRAAGRFLAERLEGNLLAAAQEIERLALLYPRGMLLGVDEVRAAVADSARFDSFRLVELVLNAQAGAALRCIRGLRDADTAMPMIISALARELRLVLGFQTRIRRMSKSAAFAELEVWRSRQAAIDRAAGQWSAHALRSALAELADLDRMAKSNDRHEFWVALERLCVQLTTASGARRVA